MFRSLGRKRRFGFTLVEVLVTTVVIGVLAAVVLPALAKQTSAADPARVASDLNNIKMGIELFANNLRPDYPGDLEDLVNEPGGTLSTTAGPSSVTDDLALDGGFYTNRVLWKGPYVAQTLPAVFYGNGSTPWKAGAAGAFENRLLICNLAAAAACTTLPTTTVNSGAFVTVQLNNISTAEASTINDMLDGASETNSATSGMFRHTGASGTTAFYYTIPYTP